VKINHCSLISLTYRFHLTTLFDGTDSKELSKEEEFRLRKVGFMKSPLSQFQDGRVKLKIVGPQISLILKHRE